MPGIHDAQHAIGPVRQSVARASHHGVTSTTFRVGRRSLADLSRPQVHPRLPKAILVCLLLCACSILCFDAVAGRHRGIRDLQLPEADSLLGVYALRGGDFLLFSYQLKTGDFRSFRTSDYPRIIEGSTSEQIFFVHNNPKSGLGRFSVVQEGQVEPSNLDQFGFATEKPSILRIFPERKLLLAKRLFVNEHMLEYSLWNTDTYEMVDRFLVTKTPHTIAMRASPLFGSDRSRLAIEEVVLQDGGKQHGLRICNIQPFRETEWVKTPNRFILHMERCASGDGLLVIRGDSASATKITFSDGPVLQEFELVEGHLPVSLANRRDVQVANGLVYTAQEDPPGLFMLPFRANPAAPHNGAEPVVVPIPIGTVKANWGFTLDPTGKQLVTWNGGNSFTVSQVIFPSVVMKHFRIEYSRRTRAVTILTELDGENSGKKMKR